MRRWYILPVQPYQFSTRNAPPCSSGYWKLPTILDMEEPRKRFAGMMSGLDVHYDLGEGHPLLGRRMPDLDLITADGPVRVFTLLHDARPVLLDLGGSRGLDITPWADRVPRVAAEYAGAWELPVLGEVAAPAAVLVRPDGHVAWVGDGTERARRRADHLVRTAGARLGRAGVARHDRDVQLGERGRVGEVEAERVLHGLDAPVERLARDAQGARRVGPPPAGGAEGAGGLAQRSRPRRVGVERAEATARERAQARIGRQPGEQARQARSRRVDPPLGERRVHPARPRRRRAPRPPPPSPGWRRPPPP